VGELASGEGLPENAESMEYSRLAASEPKGKCDASNDVIAVKSPRYWSGLEYDSHDYCRMFCHSVPCLGAKQMSSVAEVGEIAVTEVEGTNAEPGVSSWPVQDVGQLPLASEVAW
jgi:hypothetical protein